MVHTSHCIQGECKELQHLNITYIACYNIAIETLTVISKHLNKLRTEILRSFFCLVLCTLLNFSFASFQFPFKYEQEEWMLLFSIVSFLGYFHPFFTTYMKLVSLFLLTKNQCDSLSRVIQKELAQACFSYVFLNLFHICCLSSEKQASLCVNEKLHSTCF